MPQLERRAGGSLRWAGIRKTTENHEMDLRIGQWHDLMGFRIIQKQMFHRITRMDIYKNICSCLRNHLTSTVVKAFVLRHKMSLAGRIVQESQLPFLKCLHSPLCD